jgi:hypothetical protein
MCKLLQRWATEFKSNLEREELRREKNLSTYRMISLALFGR